MRYPRILLTPFLLFLILCPSQALTAKMGEVKLPTEISKEEGPVEIEADQLIYDQDEKTYQAHGAVEVNRGDISLKADHAQINMITKEVKAWGNVVLREGEDVMECERLEVNLETRLGKIYNARLFLKEQNFHIEGREAEKLGENHYRLREGSLTTCDEKKPPWKFTVRELEVKEMMVGGWAIAKGPVFHIKDIPVLYFPYGIFPVRKERQSGFLIPRLGYSKKYGPEIKNGFYWAMAKNMDATLTIEWLGERGVKGGLEYRYALTRETKGQANLYYLDDRYIKKDRYAIFAQHQQRLPYDFYLKWNINHVSDIHYVRDFDEDLPEEAKIDSRSRRQLRSNLFGGKNWDQFSFLVDTAVYRDLMKVSNDETVQKLPQVSFFAHPQSLFGTPFFYEISSSYTNFWREKGVEAQRGDLFPKISFPLRLFNVLKLESSLGLRETLYRIYDDPQNRLKGWESRETLEAVVEMGAEFYRIYEGDTFSKISSLYQVSRWMHTIEPTVRYSYSPRVRQSDLPLFDEVDRMLYTNQITYGVTQRLVGKPLKQGEASGPYEYAKLRVFQSYSFGNPLQRESNGKGRDFSNIRAEMWLNFGPYLSAKGETELNPYHGRFDVLNGVVTVKDRREDMVQVEYRSTKIPNLERVKAINLNARVKTIPPLYLFGSFRYNLLEGMRIETIYGAEYQAQCWTLAVTLEDRNRSPDHTQKRDLKFQIFINLLNLGSVGHKPYLMKL
jgi:LPS-assembly protein